MISMVKQTITKSMTLMRASRFTERRTGTYIAIFASAYLSLLR